jgi:hypothetical protein
LDAGLQCREFPIVGRPYYAAVVLLLAKVVFHIYAFPRLVWRLTNGLALLAVVVPIAHQEFLQFVSTMVTKLIWEAFADAWSSYIFGIFSRRSCCSSGAMRCIANTFVLPYASVIESFANVLLFLLKTLLNSGC